jgi:cyclopropane fatty-acyl-phospholipid synthase-like methyltransferase
MSNLDNPIRVDGGQQQVKQCCATLYESDLARFLLGDSLHPGGMELTRQLGHMLGLNPASRLLDVASGNGTTAVYLAKEFGCTIVGVATATRMFRRLDRLPRPSISNHA